MEKVAIVGMGISGMAVASAYAKEVDANRVEIDCYDNWESFGRGFPFREDSDHLLINIRKDKISYDYENLDDFKQWLDDQGYSFGDYVPRHIFGEYTQDRLDETMNKIKANKKSSQVKMLIWEKKKNKWRLETEQRNIQYYHRVHLCCGELPQKDIYNLERYDKYINKIYPSYEKLKVIDQGSSVAIIGTSLAAVDVIRYLLIEKNIEKIYFFSRGNIIPTLRLRDREININIMTYEKCLDIIKSGNGLMDYEIFDELFNQELESHGLDFEYLMKKYTPGIKALEKSMNAEEELGKVQALLTEMTNTFTRVWYSFTASDKTRFSNKYEDFIQAFGNPLPKPTVEVLLDAVNSHRLTLLNDVSDIIFNEKENVFELLQESNGSKSILVKSDFVCNATGLDTSLDSLSRENSLIGKMIDHRYLQVDDSGGITVLPKDVSVLSPRLGELRNLHGHGVLISGVQLRNNSTSVIQKTAHELIKFLYRD